MKSIIASAAIVAVASAFTQPVQPPTYGSLLLPDSSTPVTTGQTFNIKWTPKASDTTETVSLVLCNGPSSNCVLQSTAIVEGIPATAGTYAWDVPCSLPSGEQNTATGYGMLIIVDQTGEFQYSMQFSVNAGSCSSSTTTTTSAVTTTSKSSSTTSSASKSTTSASGKPSSSPTSSGWYQWSTSANSTSSSVPAYTASSSKPAGTTAPAYTTSAAWTTSAVVPSTSVAAVTTSPSPKPYTGAAAVPTAFANVAGVVGAAVLGMMAL